MNRFTDQAQQAFAHAHEAMLRLNHSYVDTEHVLLGLLEQEESTAKTMLARLGTDTAALKRRVENALQGSQPPSTRPGNQMSVYVSPRVRQLGATAAAEADRNGEEYISTEHILLALSRATDNPAGRILNEAGLNP